jgi:hypothetical protein
VVKRFFFYRVNTKTTGATVAGQNDGTIYILTDKAAAAFSFPKLAVLWTEITLHPTVSQMVPILGRVAGIIFTHDKNLSEKLIYTVSIGRVELYGLNFVDEKWVLVEVI